MRRQEMLEGREYIVDKIGVATYAGVHDGLMVDANGMEFHGGKGCLRFVVAGDDDTPQRVVLIGDGRDVIESVETRKARQKMEAERDAERARFVAEARSMMDHYRIEIADQRGAYREENKTKVRINERVMWESLDSVELQNFTIGHLLQVLGQATMEAREERAAITP